MVENGMLIGADRYDVQCREPQMVKCYYCHQRVPEYETQSFPDGAVCGDCLHDYLDDCCDRFGDEYIAKNEALYLSSDMDVKSPELLYNWWLENQTKAERLRILKAIYALECALVGSDCVGWEQAFVTQSGDWETFVRNHR